MNTKKKIMILSMVFILLVTISGTLAYSTSIEDDVKTLSTSKVAIKQYEFERQKDASNRYTTTLKEFSQKQEITPAYLVNDEIELSGTPQQWDEIGVDSENTLYADSIKNVIDKFVFIKNIGKTEAYYRTIIAFECPNGFDYSLIHINKNENNKFKWEKIGYVNLGEHRYYFIAATYKNILEADETSIPSLLQVFLDPKTTNEHMDLLGDTFDILVKTQAAQSVDGQTSEQVLNKVFGEMNENNLTKWFDLRTKYDVENYTELNDFIEVIDEDSIINIKDDIDEYETSTISISGKKLDISDCKSIIYIR